MPLDPPTTQSPPAAAVQPAGGPPHVPPQNLEAEESVLGAMLLSPGAIAAVSEILTVTDFYRESHSRIYRAALSVYEHGEAVDAITVVDELEKRGELDQVGGRSRIHELAAIVPATANAAHYARIVREMATLRGLARAGAEISRLARDRPGEITDLLARAQDIVDDITAGDASAKLDPLWLSDAIVEEVPETTEFVKDVLECGVLADIVGLPYLHKSAIALELAAKVARGTGQFLGAHQITAKAKVAYFWADDSRAQELKRIHAYANRHGLADVIGRDLAFYLNPGITFPDAIPQLKAQIRQHGFRLLIFDSLYNFAPGIDWSKDTAVVTAIYAALKRLCDQVEGLTIVLVDHASKPDDGNRGRHASISQFGSVFKAASVRCSIVVERGEGKKLFVSATGNNVRGFDRIPAFFGEDELELKLADQPTEEEKAQATEELDLRVLDYIRAYPGASTNKIESNIKGRGARIRSSLARLEAANLIYDAYGSSSQLPGTNPDELDADAYSEPRPDATGRTGTKKSKTAWHPLKQAAEPRPDQNGTNADEPRPAEGSFASANLVPETLSPRRGEGRDELAEEPMVRPGPPDTDDIDWR